MKDNKNGQVVPFALTIFISLNGVGLAWYEAIFANFDRAWLLALAGGMMGILPAQLLDKALSQWRDKQ